MPIRPEFGLLSILGADPAGADDQDVPPPNVRRPTLRRLFDPELTRPLRKRALDEIYENINKAGGERNPLLRAMPEGPAAPPAFDPANPMGLPPHLVYRPQRPLVADVDAASFLNRMLPPAPALVPPAPPAPAAAPPAPAAAPSSPAAAPPAFDPANPMGLPPHLVYRPQRPLVADVDAASFLNRMLPHRMDIRSGGTLESYLFDQEGNLHGPFVGGQPAAGAPQTFSPLLGLLEDVRAMREAGGRNPYTGVYNLSGPQALSLAMQRQKDMANILSSLQGAAVSQGQLELARQLQEAQLREAEYRKTPEFLLLQTLLGAMSERTITPEEVEMMRHSVQSVLTPPAAPSGPAGAAAGDYGRGLMSVALERALPGSSQVIAKAGDTANEVLSALLSMYKPEAIAENWPVLEPAIKAKLGTGIGGEFSEVLEPTNILGISTERIRRSLGHPTQLDELRRLIRQKHGLRRVGLVPRISGLGYGPLLPAHLVGFLEPESWKEP